MCTCVSWATHRHKNGTLLDEVEKVAIRKFYLPELGNSPQQECCPAGWGLEISNQQVLPTRAGQLPPTRMAPRCIRLRKEQSARFTYLSWTTPCPRMAPAGWGWERSNQQVLPMRAGQQEWRPTGWGCEIKDQQFLPGWARPHAATRMAPRWMRLRKELLMAAEPL